MQWGQPPTNIITDKYTSDQMSLGNLSGAECDLFDGLHLRNTSPFAVFEGRGPEKDML